MEMAREQQIRALRDITNCTVIVIPYDIAENTIIAQDGNVTSQKFNQIQLRGVIGDAERKRRDREFERVSKRLKV